MKYQVCIRKFGVFCVCQLILSVLAAVPPNGLSQSVPARRANAAASASPLEIVVQQGHNGGLHAMAFTSNGSLIATEGDDDSIKIWEVNAGLVRSSIPVDGSRSGHVVFSPDGKVLAVSVDRALQLYDTVSGKLLRTINHDEQPQSIDFSPDSSTVALGAPEDTVSLWNTHTGGHIRSIRTHVGWVGMVRFSPNGDLLASSGGEHGMGSNNLEVWRVTTGELVRTILTASEVDSAAFSPDGKTIALGCGNSSNGTISTKLWDLKTGALVKSLPGREFCATALSYSPDGSTLVVADGAGITRVWNPVTGALIRTMGERGFVLPVAVSPNARFSSECVWGGTIRIYETATGTQKLVIGCRLHDMSHLAVCDHGLTLVSGGALVKEGWNGGQRASTGEFLFWDMRTGLCKGNILWGDDIGAWSSFSVTPDGRLMVVTDMRAVALWDIRNKKLLGELGEAPGEKRRFTSVAISPDGNHVAIGGERPKRDSEKTEPEKGRSGRGPGPESKSVPFFEIWDTRSLKRQTVITGITYAVLSAVFSSDGARLFGAGDLNSITAWDAKTGAPVKTFSDAAGSIYTVRLSADDRTLIASGDGPSVQIWNTSIGGKPLPMPSSQYRSSAIDASHDGRQVAVGGPDGSIDLLSGTNGKLVRRVGGSGTYMTAVEYAPDGKSIAGLDQERGLRIWDCSTGRLKATFQAFGSTLDSGSAVEWASWTNNGYYDGSRGAERYFRWRVGGAIIDGASHKAERRKPAAVEMSLSGKVTPTLFDTVHRAAEEWQSRAQIAPTRTAESVNKTRSADAANDANAKLRASLTVVGWMGDEQKTGRVLRGVRQAIANGADVNQQGGWGTSAMMVLVSQGDLDGVKDLIKRGAKLNLHDVYGSTALLHAAEHNQPKIMQFLLSAGADVVDVKGRSLLSLNGRQAELDAALIRSIDHSSLSAGFTDGRGSRNDEDVFTPTKDQSYYDGAGTAIVLLHLGADANARGKDGRTAIQHVDASEKVAKALLEHGAEINVGGDERGYPPIVSWTMTGQTGLVRMSLDHGANPNLSERSGFTALMFAAQNGHDDITSLLLERHADPNKASGDRRTPLMMAVSEGRLEMAKHLVDHGALLEARDDYSGWTPLAFAVNRGDAEAVKYLLSKGANARIISKDGSGLIELSSQRDKQDTFGIRAMLKRYGAK